MWRRLTLVHTVASLVATFKGLCAELIPVLDVSNVVDESLLQQTIRDGYVSTLTRRRLLQLVALAEEAGADAVMVTCSSIGQVVELIRPFVSIPVFRVDEPMADEAVKLGKRIGVAATLRTTLEPTVSLLRARAETAGKPVEITSTVCGGAFDALIAGDTPRHDALVGNALRDLTEKSDVVVLAQASMARVADAISIGQTMKTPILSSPRLAIEFLARMMDGIPLAATAENIGG